MGFISMFNVASCGKEENTSIIWMMGVGSSASTIEAYSLLGSRSNLTLSIKPKVYDFVLDGVSFSELNETRTNTEFLLHKTSVLCPSAEGEKVA